MKKLTTLCFALAAAVSLLMPAPQADAGYYGVNSRPHAKIYSHRMIQRRPLVRYHRRGRMLVYPRLHRRLRPHGLRPHQVVPYRKAQSYGGGGYGGGAYGNRPYVKSNPYRPRGPGAYTDILPPSRALSVARQRNNGRIIGLNRERRLGRPVYVVKFRNAYRVEEVVVDARTGQILN
jgi:hypothetical protein